MFAREREKKERREDRKTERERESERALCYHSGGDRAAGRSEVSGGLGGKGLDAAGVTVFAEDVSVQRVAALVIPLWEQRATVLQDTDTLLVHKHKQSHLPRSPIRRSHTLAALTP